MNHKIGATLHYNTNDHRFFRPNILQIKKFAHRIVAVYSDHFFSGKLENLPRVKKAISENPEVTFVKSEYHHAKAPISERFCRLLPRTGNIRPLYGPHYWACFNRWLAYRQLTSSCDYLFFLDTDEIVDGGRFLAWLDSGEYQRLNAAIFTCFAYFRSASFQATTWEECGLLIKNRPLKKKDFLSHNDRRNVYAKVPRPKKTGILGLDARPLIHHYAWARGKAEMLRKVRSWGHSGERDWEKLVRDEFSHPFNETDFLRGYRYRKVKPFLKLV